MPGNQDPQSTVSVLFVCLGNICRSTMAEGVFRSMTKNNPRVGEIDSAGTGAYHTMEPPNYRTMAVLEKHGITDYEHGARQVMARDFDTFDYIFAMDANNLSNLQSMQRRSAKNGKAKVMLFGEFGGRKKAEPVVDPYYGTDSGFDTVYDQVKRFSENFIKEVIDKDVK